MIGRTEVLEILEKQPFEPFRICMTDGRTYDVKHPDLCIPSRRTVYVGVPDPRLRRTVVRMDQCAYAHIVRFEPINGTRRRLPRKGK